MTQEAESWCQVQVLAGSLPKLEQVLFHQLCAAALDYALARGRWQIAEHASRLALDSARTISHNHFIDACNALSRACGRHELSQEWRGTWGDARAGEARRRIGDFACYIAYQLMLKAR